jgi:hypothetical protein
MHSYRPSSLARDSRLWKYSTFSPFSPLHSHRDAHCLLKQVPTGRQIGTRLWALVVASPPPHVHSCKGTTLRIVCYDKVPQAVQLGTGLSAAVAAPPPPHVHPCSSTNKNTHCLSEHTLHNQDKLFSLVQDAGSSPPCQPCMHLFSSCGLLESAESLHREELQRSTRGKRRGTGVVSAFDLCVSPGGSAAGFE